jgi:hypothetical protein
MRSLRPDLAYGRDLPGSLYLARACGRMAEWLCRGLQILVQRFDSASGLHSKTPYRTGISCVFGLRSAAENVLRGVISNSRGFPAPFPTIRCGTRAARPFTGCSRFESVQ